MTGADTLTRVLRGRAVDIEADRAVTQSLAADVRETDIPAVRVWTPHRQLAFGRTDAHSDGYDAARAVAESHDFPPNERSVGGRAVAYTGTTLAFVRIEPIEGVRERLDDRYEAALGDVRRGLRAVGVDAERGEPVAAFCPGAHSLQADGKIVGLAQRLTRNIACTAGIVIVSDHEEISAVLEPVYDALGVPFDPESVGSVDRAGGDPQRVRTSIESSLVGDSERQLERLHDDTRSS